MIYAKDNLQVIKFYQKVLSLFSDTCHGLAHGLSTCLRFFNENCDPHLFKEGKPAFTAATIGMAFSLDYEFN